MNNSLKVRSINELFGERFHIPSYQRGYRWTEKQVTDLLEDVWHFGNTPQSHEIGKDKPFYCLQPIVVKQNDREEWDVIDGQQRLTTIYLILKNLEGFIDGSTKNFGKIEYETRKESEHYLKSIVEADKDANVDYYHIYNANKTISEWFANKANNGFSSARIKFLTPFLEDTKVIWYQVNDGTEAIDIFTRINIGKIPLTNAELVKALFLKQGNFDKGGISNIRLKQIQISSEWDKIESVLQDDGFWHFIYQGNKKYSTRIEYIFDLMKGKNPNHDPHYTFYEFHKDYLQDTDKEKATDRLWLSIKKYFQTFEEWFKDREFYHLIGYLITSGYSVSTLIAESKNYTKTEFKERLRSKIKGVVNYSSDDLDELDYNDRIKVKSILLLFNIQTILSNKASNIRFPFDSYKKEDWDIEHIRSVKSDMLKATSKQRRHWLETVLEYYTGKTEVKEQEKEIPNLKAEDKAFAENILVLLLQEKIAEDEFLKLYEDILQRFEENNEPDNINSISNLTLLDASTNRSYKNAVFPIKRKTILENDMKGTFIPICTKNVFLKAYSNKLDGVMFWQKKDAKDYLQAIKTTLKPYLKS